MVDVLFIVEQDALLTKPYNAFRERALRRLELVALIEECRNADPPFPAPKGATGVAIRRFRG